MVHYIDQIRIDRRDTTNTEMDPPYCDRCGETHATVRLAEVGLCDGCSEIETADHLETFLGYRPCATRVWHGNQQRLCLEVWGLEHDHA